MAYGADINSYINEKNSIYNNYELVYSAINNEEKWSTTCDVLRFHMEKGT